MRAVREVTRCARCRGARGYEVQRACGALGRGSQELRFGGRWALKILRSGEDKNANSLGKSSGPTRALVWSVHAKRFQDLICWQLSRELRNTVFRLTKTPKLARDFDLCDQLRSATRSATGNIAEGFPCASRIERARFLEIAIRSIAETEDRLIEAVDNEYITDAEAAPAMLPRKARFDRNKGLPCLAARLKTDRCTSAPRAPSYLTHLGTPRT